MKKAGMQFEGILRHAGKNNTGICDSAVYAILKEDYCYGIQYNEMDSYKH